MVAHLLPKQVVAGSSPVSRSTLLPHSGAVFLYLLAVRLFGSFSQSALSIMRHSACAGMWRGGGWAFIAYPLHPMTNG